MVRRAVVVPGGSNHRCPNTLMHTAPAEGQGVRAHLQHALATVTGMAGTHDTGSKNISAARLSSIQACPSVSWHQACTTCIRTCTHVSALHALISVRAGPSGRVSRAACRPRPHPFTGNRHHT